MRNLFFAMTDNKKNPYGEPEKVDTLAMIGAGIHGSGHRRSERHQGY